MRSNSDYLGPTALFYTDCLFEPGAGMLLFYGHTWQITNSLFSLEFYGVIYKGLTTNIITFPDYPRCNFRKNKIWLQLLVAALTKMFNCQLHYSNIGFVVVA